MAINSNNMVIPPYGNYNMPQGYGVITGFPFNQTYFNVLILCYKSENSVDIVYQSQNPFIDEQSAIHYMKYMAICKVIELSDVDTKISSIEDRSDNEKHHYRYYKIHVNGNLFVEGFVYDITNIDINTVRYRGHIIKNDISSSRITVVNESYPYTTTIPEFETNTTQPQPIWYKRILQYIDKMLEDSRINSMSELKKRKAYLRQRQAEGIEAAKKRGVYKGRKPVERPEFKEVAGLWRNHDITAKEAMRRLNMSSSTFYRNVKRAGL